MRSLKTYFWLALFISILFGIVLPLVLGVRDIMVFAFLFTLIWLIYAITLLIWVFLITGRKNLKKRLKEGIRSRRAAIRDSKLGELQ